MDKKTMGSEKIKVGDMMYLRYNHNLRCQVVELISTEHIDYALVACVGFDDPKYIILGPGWIKEV